ncbi:MAG: hypothetical protein RRY21_06965 [Oscillospiraceae bacterium]
MAAFGNRGRQATGMVLAATILGLSLTEELSVADQNEVANLLFVAAQAISSRASLLPGEEGGPISVAPLR